MFVKKTRILSCLIPPFSHEIAEAVTVLHQGGLVAFPTETVYGLGANALDPAAVTRIFVAKGRPSTNPLIVHVASLDQIPDLAALWSAQAVQLADAFWPGPLTLVVPRHRRVPDVVTAGGPTVAIRIPAHPLTLALLKACNLPIAAPSANRSNRLSPTQAEHVFNDLDGAIDLILDGGPTTGGIESTVLDITTDPPRLLRPGLIDPVAIEAIIGPIERSHLPIPDESKPLPSPGMLSRHYAPRTPLEFAEDDGTARVRQLLLVGRRVGWVRRKTLANDSTVLESVNLITRDLPADPVGYAAEIYATLHQLDSQHLDRIVVSQLPLDDAWLGIRDRLIRAAE